VLTTLARCDEALNVLERAAAYHAAAGDLENLGRVTAQIGHAHAQKGAPKEGLARIQPLLTALEERGPSPSLAQLYAEQADHYALLYLHHEQLAAATRALELARVLRDEGLLARALGMRGSALIFVGRVEESLEALEEARRLAEGLGELSRLRDALSRAALGHYALGALAASGRCAEMALDASRRLGDPMAIASNLAARGRYAFLMGDWSRARTDLEQAIALARQTGVTPCLVHAATFLGEYYLAAGKWNKATRRLNEARAAAERGVQYGRLRHAQGLLAEHDLYAGRPEAARDRLLPLAEAENTFAPWLRTQLAWAYLELGEASLAAETVARAIRQSRSEKHRVRLVDGLHVQAMILARLGRVEQAAAALDEGLALAPALPYPYGEARLLAVYGRLNAQAGQPEQARDHLAAALAIFRRLGARKDVERTEQALATLS
jgi:tetratricopeptide (TPR) repeat protein